MFPEARALSLSTWKHMFRISFIGIYLFENKLNNDDRFSNGLAIFGQIGQFCCFFFFFGDDEIEKYFLTS